MSEKLTTKYLKIANRAFIQLGNHCIPIESIEAIDCDELWALKSHNRVAVYYRLDNASAKAEFSDNSADLVREFLGLDRRSTGND